MTQQLTAASQLLFSATVGQEAIMADTHKALGQDVQEEAADKLGRLQGHDALPLLPEPQRPTGEV